MRKSTSLIAFFLIAFTRTGNAQVYGCTDPMANNFNSAATHNDGSCTYPAGSVSPSVSFNLAANLAETSGLICWNDRVWTHNDNADINLYALDTSNGSLIQSHLLAGQVNIDWEEISQDSQYVYVGDFGNNVNGNRTDLRILRIEKNSLLLQSPVIDTIGFSYSDQVDFTPTGSNNTDFDCEAFVVASDSIYLFTKQWVSNETSVYALPKMPGSHIAVLKTTYDVEGLITGAALLPAERVIALCGYTSLLQPFTWLLYDFAGSDFFSGNKRKVSIPLPFHQVEGIATVNGLTWYMTNEYFSIIPTPQKFHVFDFTSFLGDYLNNIFQVVPDLPVKQELFAYPVPADDMIFITSENSSAPYYLFSPQGEAVRSGQLVRGKAGISIAELAKGLYLLRVGDGYNSVLKIIKD